MLSTYKINKINPFVCAAWSGNVEEMVTATVRDVNVMAKLNYFEPTATALYFASYQGQLEAVWWLLAQEGIDVNRGDPYGTSPLHAASGCGHEAVVEALITAGADANHRHRRGFTALMAASARGHTVTVRRLIAAGARVNLTDSNGCTALDYAQCRRHTATVELLLAHRAMPGTRTYQPPLHTRLFHPTDAPFALSREEALPEALAWTDAFGRTALHYAALAGNHTAYTVLYSAMRAAGVDTEGVDGGGYTAMDHLVCVCVSTVDNF
jgi:ankyrin repeat protein